MRQNVLKPADYPNVLTVEEFAEVFKLSPEAVRNLIRRGEIQAIRIGKQYRIPQHVVDRYFAQTLAPAERGFGMWRRKPVTSLAYVNTLRRRGRRSPEGYLRNMARDD